MNRKEQIKNLITNLREELHTIEAEEKSEWAQQFLGKCYKIRNNYSCPKKESDYWWKYYHVVDIDNPFYLVAISFEMDSQGTISFYANTPFTQSTANSGIEIDYKEYLEEFSKLIRFLTEYQKED